MSRLQVLQQQMPVSFTAGGEQLLKSSQPQYKIPPEYLEEHISTDSMRQQHSMPVTHTDRREVEILHG